eukprot:scpid88716/ scgid11472/ 
MLPTSILRGCCARYSVIHLNRSRLARTRICVRSRSFAAGNPATAEEFFRRQNVDYIKNVQEFITEHSFFANTGRRTPQELVVEAVRIAYTSADLTERLGNLAETCIGFLHIGTFSTTQLLYLFEHAKLPSMINADILEELHRRNLLADELVCAFGGSVAGKHIVRALDFWRLICSKRHELSAVDKMTLRKWFLHPNSNLIRQQCIRIGREEETHGNVAARRQDAGKRWRVNFNMEDLDIFSKGTGV